MTGSFAVDAAAASVCRVENLLERAKVFALRGLDEGRSIRALQIHGSSFLVQVSGVAARVRSLRTLVGWPGASQ
jgi:hypothetical protein